MNNFDMHYKFWKMDGIDFMNSEFIHPLKQSDVSKVVEGLESDSNVMQIVVFGSAVDIRCSSQSDIDIYIKLADPSKVPKLSVDIQSEIDLLYDIPKYGLLYQEIDKEGIVVYERKGKCAI